jgi:hypothetical protein
VLAEDTDALGCGLDALGCGLDDGGGEELVGGGELWGGPSTQCRRSSSGSTSPHNPGDRPGEAAALEAGARTAHPASTTTAAHEGFRTGPCMPKRGGKLCAEQAKIPRSSDAWSVTVTISMRLA